LIPDLPPIPGVPDKLIQAINERLRKVVRAVSRAIAGAEESQIAVGNRDGSLSFDRYFVWTGTTNTDGRLGVGTQTPFVDSVAHFHFGSNQNLLIADKALLATGVTLRSVNDAVADQGGLEIRCSQLMLTHAADREIGFFGGTPAVQQVLDAYAPDDEGFAYLGIATGLGGTPYAANAALESLRTAYENLRAEVENLREKLLATTLVDE